MMSMNVKIIILSNNRRMTESKKIIKYLSDCDQPIRDLTIVHDIIFNDNTKVTTKYLSDYLDLRSRYNEIMDDIKCMENKSTPTEHKQITMKITIFKFYAYDLKDKMTKKKLIP